MTTIIIIRRIQTSNHYCQHLPLFSNYCSTTIKLTWTLTTRRRKTIKTQKRQIIWVRNANVERDNGTSCSSFIDVDYAILMTRISKFWYKWKVFYYVKLNSIFTKTLTLTLVVRTTTVEWAWCICPPLFLHHRCNYYCYSSVHFHQYWPMRHTSRLVCSLSFVTWSPMDLTTILPQVITKILIYTTMKMF